MIRIRWGPAIVLVLAALGPAWNAAADTPTVLMGIVGAGDQERGALILERGDGTRSHHIGAPGLLGNIRAGDPVQAVVEGATVRTLVPL